MVKSSLFSFGSMTGAAFVPAQTLTTSSWPCVTYDRGTGVATVS